MAENTQTQAPASSTAAETAAPAPVEAAPSPAAAESERVDLDALLGKVDPYSILDKVLEKVEPKEVQKRSRALGGLIGRQVKEQLQQQIDAATAQAQQQQHEQWLNQLPPDQFKQYILQNEEYRRWEQQASRNLKLQAFAEFQRDYLSDYPPDAQMQFMERIASGEIDSAAKLKKAVREWELKNPEADAEFARRIREAQEEAVEKFKAANNWGTHSADIPAGAAPAGRLTQDEFNRNRKNLDWVRANKERVNEAVAAGRIRY